MDQYGASRHSGTRLRRNGQVSLSKSQAAQVGVVFTLGAIRFADVFSKVKLGSQLRDLGVAPEQVVEEKDPCPLEVFRATSHSHRQES